MMTLHILVTPLLFQNSEWLWQAPEGAKANLQSITVLGQNPTAAIVLVVSKPQRTFDRLMEGTALSEK